MGKRMKVYLPRWTRWMVLGLLVVMWGFVTYTAFFTAQGRRDMGWGMWGFVTAVLVAAGTMMWLMSSGKLPAYIIEEEDDGK